ncbi:MAG: hypothetical protein JWQ34_3679 [Mucilaginibacter sp.]|uniref:hypothetical protein n=1 Tax=Mucilaginibacter sp. TaxID=1882438 RepID=UPI0026116AF1|nr:hypothetical protein [Mucilaginibacter sp.]MDB5005454.1 hypothetical protein [Mucilaginibacter sp.]
MNKLFSLSILFLGLSAFTIKKSDAVKNFYGIPETLTFDKVDFKLSASYHPNEHYYKQEYIPSGESPDHFNAMLVIDFYITDAPNKKLAELKEKELDARKKTDVVVNYEQFENTELNEYILDFILSDGKGDKLNVVEHNVYHYANYTDKAGHKGILLFGISKRGYGDDIPTFIKLVKENKIDNVNKLSSYPLPKIEIN